MATKKQVNQLKKQVKKSAKNNPKLFAIIAAIIIVIAVVIGVIFFLNKPGEDNPDDDHKPRIITEDEISINFLELGNHHTGDCTYIKAGSIDILIDAGSVSSSADTIDEFLKQPGRVGDGKLEYVIATHAHEDHISGFVGSSSTTGLLDRYKVDTVIMYAGKGTASKLSINFENMLQEKAQKEGTKIVKASEAVGKTYTFSENFTMEILNQKFYASPSSDENNNSVCTLITQGESHYLFTGDLEAEGEASLIELNNLPQCRLFKGGHHGSNTSNSKKLLDVIKPEIICICCCAGNYEYAKTLESTFPYQVVVERMLQYTDKIYVTTYSTDTKTGFASLNGNITFISDGVNYTIHGSNSDKILTESDWYKSRLDELKKEA